MFDLAAIGCLIAAFLCADDSAIGQERSRNRESVAQQTEENSKRDIDTEKANFDAAFWATRDGDKTETYRQICKNPKDREYADLCQQWRTAEAAVKQAKWVIPMFWATLVSAVGLVVSLIFTGWAAVTAGRAARAAQETVRATHDAERAHIFCDDLTFDIPAPSKFYEETSGWQNILITYCLTNFGRTPAVVSEIRAEVQILPSLPPIRTFIYGNTWRGDTVIKPDVKYGATTIGRISFPDPIPPDDVKKIKAGSLAFFLFGYARYSDVFGSQREYGFCFRIFPPLYYFGTVNHPEYKYEKRIEPPPPPGRLRRLLRRLGVLAT